MIIGIDSMILIYAEIVPLKKGPKCKDISDLRKRSKLLIIKASDRRDTIVLPTVVMSELLVPVPNSQKGALILALQKRFVCPPLDIPAASMAADLWSQFTNRPQNQDYGNRDVLKADVLIVASARAGNATQFYSHDARCRTLAELAGMEAFDLPSGQSMDDKFLLADIEEGIL